MEMKECMPLDGNLNAVPVWSVGVARDVADTAQKAAPVSGVVRLCALTDCRIWVGRPAKEGDGLFLPEGAVEYFKLDRGDVLEVEGTVNLTDISPC